MTITEENSADEENQHEIQAEEEKRASVKEDGGEEIEPEAVANEEDGDEETGGAKGEEEDEDGQANPPEPRFPFPKAFYDPITNKIMIDPVVLPDGESYEKAGVVERDDGQVFYPNRALKAYIEAEIDRFGDAGTVRAAVQQWGESLRSGWQRLLEKSALPSGEFRPLPDSFYCPITFELIHEPAIDPDGHSYEKAAIYQWIQANGDSPVTRKPLTADQMYDNTALLNVLMELTKENGVQPVHPSIRRWKEEHAARPDTPTPRPDPQSSNAQQASGTSGGAAGQQNTYPTTREELEELQRLRNRKHATVCGILVVCLLVFFFLPSYFLFFLMLLVAASIVYAPQMARHRQLEERRREIIALAHRQQRQRQQQQQQQQQQGEP